MTFRLSIHSNIFISASYSSWLILCITSHLSFCESNASLDSIHCAPAVQSFLMTGVSALCEMAFNVAEQLWRTLCTESSKLSWPRWFFFLQNSPNVDFHAIVFFNRKQRKYRDDGTWSAGLLADLGKPKEANQPGRTRILKTWFSYREGPTSAPVPGCS